MPERQESGKSRSRIRPRSDHCVYRVFDEVGQLLYVGVSSDVFLRFAQHAQRAPWVAYVASVTFEQHPTREAAEAAEAEAIRTEDPVWNMDGRPFGRFMQWMKAYPDGNPDDFDVADLIRRTSDLIGKNTNPYNQGETQP